MRTPPILSQQAGPDDPGVYDRQRRSTRPALMTAGQSFTTLISSEDLARLWTEAWVLVDCRYDLRDAERGRRDYLAAHVPGAVYASLSDDLSGPPSGTNGRHPLPTPATIQATFGRLGIGAGVQVVTYDQDSGMFAARLWWTLRFLGHDEVAVLDGGFARWQRESRPVEAGEVTPAPASFAGEPLAGWSRDVADVEAALGSSATLLVDARAPDRFAGENETIDRAAGHIPGAVNHHYQSNVAADGTFLPANQLRAQFASTLGVHRPGEVVCYCGSGVTACHNLLAMAHAGLDGASLFVGSWSEWSSNPKRPRETGPARRR